MGQETKQKDLLMVQLQEMPNDAFLLVITKIGNNSKGATVISLDEIPDQGIRTSLYMDAVRKYGEDNVRFCKIVTAKVRQTVEFVE